MNNSKIKFNFTKRNILKTLSYLFRIIFIVGMGSASCLEPEAILTSPMYNNYFPIFSFILGSLLGSDYYKDQNSFSTKWKVIDFISDISAAVITLLLIGLNLYTSLPFLIIVPLQIIIGIYFIFSDIIIRKLHSYFCKDKSNCYE